jgi:CelD/BcsL family acetyltransferase involved in cellulose biosynthesis
VTADALQHSRAYHRTGSADQPTFSLYSDLGSLPEGSARLFESESDLALRAEWFSNLVATGLSPGSAARFGVLQGDKQVIGIVPFQEEGHQRLASLTNCYSCLYRPLITPGTSVAENSFLLGRGLGRRCAEFPSALFDCLPADWPGLVHFTAGLREQGLAVRSFDHFGNWHEPLRGRSWHEYIASRPGALREVLRRRTKRAAQIGGISCEIIDRPEDLVRGMTAFETVYQRSWKPPEPFPRFNFGLMEVGARLGVLRLGICWHHDRPIATQLWIVSHGTATVMKLAHDEAEHALSPGTLLTAAVIETLMSSGIDEIDFGRGDDAYKRLWATQRRQRIGLLVANPRRPKGLAILARHELGRVTRRGRSPSRIGDSG